MGVSQKSKCRQNCKDCFAYNDGYCRVLNSGSFRGKCPFYKAEKVYFDGLKQYPIVIMDEKISREQMDEWFGLNKEVCYVR
jgi:hypothetical protein